MNWLMTSLYWYGVVFILGIIFLPLTKKILGRFFLDFGYPFAKVLAILFLSYSIFVLGMIKLLPFTQIALFFVLIIFVLLNLIIFRKKLRTTDYLPAGRHGGRRTILLIIFEELLFLVSFLFWVYVRGQEPSLRSLEKFMDFGFINSILRSRYFPPLDIWLSADPTHPSGYPINYYYFGHLVGATLIKLTNIKPAVGYNLILATIFGLAITQVFSLVINLIYNYLSATKKIILKTADLIKIIFIGLVGALITNLGGNLHTIYLFTTGYPNENPIPFWQILDGYNPTKYWYPNATRLIPFTIHEFPSYSYVVADLHGHVFDIPFVLLTLSILFLFFTNKKPLTTNYSLLTAIFLGFLTAVHYMTNAFDGPIYILLSIIILFFLYRLTWRLFLNIGLLLLSFFIFSLPFSYYFKPFVTGIGVNCSSDLLTSIGKICPFLFEKGKCQISPPWMLFILWGFFWVSFLLFVIATPTLRRGKQSQLDRFVAHAPRDDIVSRINNFILIIFVFSTILVIIPEFFYIKDIYPAHFRANTMFKLGYQAFIMMSLAAAYTFFQIKLLKKNLSLLLTFIFIFFFFFVIIYPFFSIPSYYGNLNREVILDGETWLATAYPEDKEIVDFLNKNIKDQPVILEAQGDSYTDYDRISAATGLPTIAGWWVHEWLWRGSSEVIAQRIPDVIALYESKDISKTNDLIKKYHIKYVIISGMERQKYPNLDEKKFTLIGKLIFQSRMGDGAIYQVSP